MERWLSRAIEDSVGYLERERSAQVAQLSTFALVCSVAWLAFGVGYAIVGRPRSAGVAMVVVFCTLLARAWVVRKVRTPAAVNGAAHLMTSFSVVGLFFLALLSGGTPVSVAGWFLIAVPLFAAYQFDRPVAVGWALAATSVLLLLFFAGDRFGVTPEFVPSEAERLVGQLAVLGLLLSFAVSYGRLNRRRVDRLSEQAASMRRIAGHAEDQKRLFEAIAELSPNLIYIVDLEEGATVYANRDLRKRLGYGREELRTLGPGPLDGIGHPEDAPLLERQRRELDRLQDGAHLEFVRRVRHRDGSYRHLLVAESVFRRRADGRPRQALGVAQDITAQRRTQGELQDANDRLRTLVDTLPQAVVVTDRTGGVVVVNAGLKQLLAYDGATDALIGQHIGVVLDRVGGSLFGELDRLMDTMEKLLVEARDHAMGELPLFDGRTLQIECVPLGQRDDPQGWLWSLRDVTDRTRRERALVARIQRDALTGIASRDHFREELDRACAHGAPFALLFVDLDGFKQVNDTHGHAAGDAVLKAVASRLASRTRAGDLVARLGGDEFTVILRGVTPDRDPESIVRHIVADVASPVEAEGRVLVVTATIGVAFFPHSTSSAEGLLRLADDAMYEAKQRGKNTFAMAPREHPSGVVRQKGSHP